jgi:hypothetical protein
MRKKLIQSYVFTSLVLVLLISAGIASAELKSTAVVYAWDEYGLQYRNSNVPIPWDGTWVPFLHQLEFDDTAYTPDFDPDPGNLNHCYSNGRNTPWEGVMEFGLYHTDNGPPSSAGAEGWQQTANWRLVDCDRDGDGDFDGIDLSGALGGYPVLGSLSPITQDVVGSCSTGNCQDEIVTTLIVNLDANCDGVKDATYPEFVCFYAEAQTPPTYTVLWGGPLQARITDGGGDKTVNFRPTTAPTAINLLSFAGESESSDYRLLISAAVFFMLGLLGLTAGYLSKLHKEK